MTRGAKLAVPAAALAVVFVAVLGGGFWPGQRLLVGAAMVVVVALAVCRRQGTPDLVEASWLMVPVWGAVSAIVVGSAPLAAKEAVTTWLIALALWAVARRGRSSSRQLAIRVLAAGAAIVAAAIVAAAAASGTIRVGGLFDNPNMAVALLVPTLPIGWVVIGPRRPMLRHAWAVVMTAGLVLSGSRAGLLALLVMVAVLLPRGRVRTTGMVAAVGLTAAALAWRFASQPDVLAWHRVSIWRAVVAIWLRRPVTGVGPGGLVEAAGVERILHPDQVGRYQFVISYAESTPLAVLVQLGLVGLGLVVVALVVWLVAARRSGALESRPIRAALVAAAVFALFHDLLTADPVLWWWAMLAGCVDHPLDRDADAAPIRLVPPAVRWIGGLSLAWLVAWGVLAPAHARLRWRAATPAADQVEQTLRIEPWFDEAPAGRVRTLLAIPEPWSRRTGAEALYWAECARRLHPGLARRWADLGRVRTRIVTDCGGTEHDVRAAEAALAHACALDPHLPWHWLERARLARIVGDYDRATSWVRRALDEEPNTVRAWFMLARLEAEMGRAEAARAALAEAEERTGLASRPGLTEYELELLRGPIAQIEELDRELVVAQGPNP